MKIMKILYMVVTWLYLLEYRHDSTWQSGSFELRHPSNTAIKAVQRSPGDTVTLYYHDLPGSSLPLWINCVHKSLCLGSAEPPFFGWGQEKFAGQILHSHGLSEISSMDLDRVLGWDEDHKIVEWIIASFG